MWRLSTLAIALAALAVPARGQQLIFGANVGARWDSNVENLPNGESDFLARVGPEVRLLQPTGDLTYDFHYVPTYQAYSRFASLDAWEELVNASLKYQLGLDTSVEVKNLFDYAPVTSFLPQLSTSASVPTGTQVINTLGHYNIVLNSASIDLSHQWSELWKTDASVSSFYYDPRVADSVSSNTSVAQGNLTYALTPLDRVGGSLSFTYQNFGSNSSQSSSTSYYYNASAVWNHDFSPTWSLKLQAGPTLVDAGGTTTAPTRTVAQFPSEAIGSNASLLFDFTRCLPLPALGGRSFLNLCGAPTLLTLSNSPLVTSTIPVPVQGVSTGSQTNLTYFANILMTKRWETVTANLGYSRSAGSSGLFTTSTEIDTLNGSVIWQTTPVWSTSLNVFWTDQSNSSNHGVSEQEIVEGFATSGAELARASALLIQQQSGTINVYQWVVGVHSEYKLTKRLNLFGNFFFLNQTSSQSGGSQLNLSDLNYNATRIDLGFHYEFDPIHL